MHCKFCGTKCSGSILDSPGGKAICGSCFWWPGKFPEWPFLRTYKPMLKRARGTASYQDVRRLLQNWMWAKRIWKLLERQNDSLFQAASERDRLLSQRVTAAKLESKPEPENEHGEQDEQET